MHQLDVWAAMHLFSEIKSICGRWTPPHSVSCIWLGFTCGELILNHWTWFTNVLSFPLKSFCGSYCLVQIQRTQRYFWYSCERTLYASKLSKVGCINRASYLAKYKMEKKELPKCLLNKTSLCCPGADAKRANLTCCMPSIMSFFVISVKES